MDHGQATHVDGAQPETFDECGYAPLGLYIISGEKGIHGMVLLQDMAAYRVEGVGGIDDDLAGLCVPIPGDGLHDSGVENREQDDITVEHRAVCTYGGTAGGPRGRRLLRPRAPCR